MLDLDRYSDSNFSGDGMYPMMKPVHGGMGPGGVSSRVTCVVEDDDDHPSLIL